MSKKQAVPAPTCSFKVPVYGGLVHVYTSQEMLNKALKFYGASENDILKIPVAGSFTPLQHSSGYMLYLLGIYQRTHDTIAHEVLHLVLHILKHAGITVTTESVEAACYLMGSLMKELYSLIGDKIRRRPANE